MRVFNHHAGLDWGSRRTKKELEKNSPFRNERADPHHVPPTTSTFSRDRYTSLGERGDTAKNEALRLPDGRYRPAYELAEEEEHLERSPRTPTDSPRAPTWVHGSGDGDEGGRGGGRAGGGGGRVGEKNKRFSSWDKEWETLDAQDVGTIATAVASGGAGEVISSASSARVGACAKSKALELSSTTSSRKTCLQPDGKLHGGGGWRGLAGLVGWLPITTVALALLLAAVGLRSSSGSSRGSEHDSAPDKAD